jgi:type II secretory pathway pseudopilin PulG
MKRARQNLTAIQLPKRAFTLIERLGVIGIITVLIAILSPVITRAQQATSQIAVPQDHSAVRVEVLEERLAAIAKRMDGCYREAGSRVDIAQFDGNELQRQGRPYPPELTAEIDAADKRLRLQWSKLESERSTIQTKLAQATDGDGGTLLQIRNLSNGGSGETGWFALRQAAVVLSDGIRIVVPARDFKGGAYRDLYSYQCDPSPMVAVYGRQSSNQSIRALISVPRGIHQAQLEISGLDHDKPGIVPIEISINGVRVWSGPNEFKKIGWSDRRYAVPDNAWSRTVERTTSETVAADLNAFESKVADFEKSAPKTADSIDSASRGARQGLVWRKREYPDDWWSRGFLRGICYETDSVLGPEYFRPWFLDNKEYVAKAFDAAKVNLIYEYPSGVDEAGFTKQYREFAKYNDQIGTPSVSVYWPASAPKPTPDMPVPAGLYTNAVRASTGITHELSALTSTGSDPSVLRGVAIDEPRIDDEQRFNQVPEILAAFRDYLKRRAPDLAAAGIVIDSSKPPVLKCTSDADRPAWMEWQYFKMEYATNFYRELSKAMAAQHRIQLLVAQDYSIFEPQVTAFPGYGSKLPIVCTDLYNDGTVTEAFVADLLRSVCKGKSILVTGAGYSARSPDHFYRTQANAMMRADGILTWIYTYAAKYRYQYFFVRPDMKDDRGRQLIDSWRPEYWDIFTRIYTGIANAEQYLVDTQSTAQIGVLYSLRSVIAESAQGSSSANHSQRNSLLTYNALQDLHISVEACMVEGLTPEKLKRFKVLFLIDSQALSATECEMLSSWVRSGGTLVVSGRTSLRDEWGRESHRFALEPILGATFEHTATGQSSFTTNMPGGKGALSVAYAPDFNYAKVRPLDAKILASWGNGDPAFLTAKVGAGRTYLITADRPGEYTCDSDVSSGRYQWSKPGFPELFQSIALAHSVSEPVEILNAPKDVEVQIRRKGEDWIVQLLDWRDQRTVRGMKLSVRMTGKYRASYPMDGVDAGMVQQGQLLSLRPLTIHDMIVLQPEN